MSNIKAEFTPPVELTVGQVDSTEYGSSETNLRPTGLRAIFQLNNTDNDVIFRVIGQGILRNDDVAVYFNDALLGHLSIGGVIQYNDGDIFTIDKASLLEGQNVIELVRRENHLGNWAVKDMLVLQESPSSSSLLLGHTDATQYGHNYGTNQNAFELDVSFTPETEHDHKISWNAYDIDQSDDLEVLLNGLRIKDVETTNQNVLGNTESITLAWRMFNPGVNTLTFKAKPNRDDLWGITNLLVKTSDVIDLDNPASLDQDYGYYPQHTGGTPFGWTRLYSTQDYQTRLYASFNNTNEDKVVSLRGWDVDSPEELSVYLNGTFLQYVNSADDSSTYSNPDRIILRKSDLVAGTNLLSIRAADNFSGFQSEKWGIIFDGFGKYVNMVPIIWLILDDGEATPAPP